jgi:amidase
LHQRPKKEGFEVPEEDLLFRPATELAAMVRSGAISARELVTLSLERIDELDQQLNAFVQVDAERALAVADTVTSGDERPFAGVPVAIKNNRAVQGLRLTYGCSLMADHVADYDHNVTRRLTRAGFIVVGTTTLPEYGILPVTEATLFGPTRNPWDLGRTPGGSSGGSAAAVAAGIVPVAHGNDGGGSIRIPAACCGLVGLKPQRGRVSLAPDLGQSLLAVDGVLTRTVADTAAILDVLAGPEVGDAAWAPPPPEPFSATAARPPHGPSSADTDQQGGLRIAATTLAPVPGVTPDPACAEAVERTADLLRSLGHEVLDVEPPWQAQELTELFGAVFSNHIGLSIAFSGAVAGRDPQQRDMEPMSWAIFSRVKTLDAVQGLALAAQLEAFSRQLVSFLEPYDALLTPALAARPLPVGALDPAAPEPLATFARSGAFTPFTPVVNATGQPAISLPLFQGEDGLPLGIQLVGRPAGEATLLALAAQMEEANPWSERRPPISEQSLSAGR